MYGTQRSTESVKTVFLSLLPLYKTHTMRSDCLSNRSHMFARNAPPGVRWVGLGQASSKASHPIRLKSGKKECVSSSPRDFDLLFLGDRLGGYLSGCREE